MSLSTSNCNQDQPQFTYFINYLASIYPNFDFSPLPLQTLENVKPLPVEDIFDFCTWCAAAALPNALFNLPRFPQIQHWLQCSAVAALGKNRENREQAWWWNWKTREGIKNHNNLTFYSFSFYLVGFVLKKKKNLLFTDWSPGLPMAFCSQFAKHSGKLRLVKNTVVYFGINCKTQWQIIASLMD